MKDTSKSYTLNKNDWRQALRRGALFLAPLALIYITQITGALQQEGYVFNVKDLIPSTFTQGAIVLYFFNRLTDLINRFIQGK